MDRKLGSPARIVGDVTRNNLNNKYEINSYKIQPSK